MRAGRFSSLFSSLLMVGIVSAHTTGHARIKNKVSESRRGVVLTPKQRAAHRRGPRKLYLNFADETHSPTAPENNSTMASSDNRLPITATSNRGTSKKMSEQKIGLSNDIQLGYSNSAYRYAGEEYPEKSFDFLINPVLESSCFSITCKYFAKLTGGVNLNDNSKAEVSLFQFGIKLPTDAWMGYLKPTYSIFGVLPTTEKQLQVEHQLYGIGGGFNLSTTPELLGSDFLKLTGGFSLKKNVHEVSADKVQSWVARQFLITDLKFSEAFSAQVLFGHINGVNYDGSEKEILEMNQSVTWQATDIVSFSLGHSNNGPLFNDAGQRLDPSMVSIDQSVISFSLGLTNSF
jgi:hypothetical protein